MESLKKRDLSIEDYIPVIISAIKAGKMAYLDVIGSSMMPTLREGDRVMLEAVHDIAKGDIILYSAGDRYIMHRVVKCGDILTVIGDNNCAKECVKREQVIARVHTICHGEKRIVRGSIAYKLGAIRVPIRRFFRRVGSVFKR